MTIQYSPSTLDLFISKGLMAGFFDYWNLPGTWATSAISVYAGVQPTAADIVANWTNYKSSNADFLLHFTGARWVSPTSDILLNLETVPAAAAAVHTGTIAWAILWQSDVADPSVGTLPDTEFIVVPCSLTSENGVVRFASLSVIASSSYSIIEGSLAATA